MRILRVDENQTTTHEGFNELLYVYLSGIFKLKKSTKGWYRCQCEFCGNKTSFGINFAFSRAKCFKCGYTKKLVFFVTEIMGLNSVHEALSRLREENSDIFSRAVNLDVTKKDVEISVTLPESFQLISFGKNTIAKAVRKYLKEKRGISIGYAAMRGVGYCTEGEYKGSLVFPWYRSGKLVYFTDRRAIPAFGPKFSNPSEEQLGIRKERLIYNHDALYLYRSIFVVESALNALTLGDRATGLGGKSMSEYVIQDIIKSPVEKITIIYDPDAIKEAIQVSIKLARYKKVRLVTWEGKEDVNSLGRAEVIRRVKQFKYRPQSFYTAAMLRYYNEPNTIITYLKG